MMDDAHEAALWKNLPPCACGCGYAARAMSMRALRAAMLDHREYHQWLQKALETQSLPPVSTSHNS